jgi:hypothetical protein
VVISLPLHVRLHTLTLSGTDIEMDEPGLRRQNVDERDSMHLV